jgi:lipoprotein-releasing system ATP-binding protein
MIEKNDDVLLSCHGITRSFSMPATATAPARELTVLNGVDLEVRRGEMVSIVGQSGTGKSTLLHIMGTLDHPSTGSVRYGEDDVFKMKGSDLARFRNKHIGFVFQFHHLLAEFSALENALLPLLIAGASRKEGINRARPILERVGLSDRLSHRPGELSGGEQQRVAIARALVMEPSIVFADEPTGNLDTATSKEIHQLLVELNEQTNTAFVVVTHNVQLAWKMERHLLMEQGKVRELNPNEAPEEFLPKGGVNG